MISLSNFGMKMKSKIMKTNTKITAMQIKTLINLLLITLFQQNTFFCLSPSHFKTKIAAWFTLGSCLSSVCCRMNANLSIRHVFFLSISLLFLFIISTCGWRSRHGILILILCHFGEHQFNLDDKLNLILKCFFLVARFYQPHTLHLFYSIRILRHSACVCGIRISKSILLAPRLCEKRLFLSN